MFRRLRLFFAVIVLIFLLFASIVFYTGSPFLGELIYDILHKNDPVYQYDHAKKILSVYPVITKENLPYHVNKNVNSQLEGKFYVIPANDVYRKLCLNNRINSFLSGEERISGYHFRGSKQKYVYVNEQLLDAFFTLVEKLNADGFNFSQLYINSSYRSKTHNDKVRGAIKSIHLEGKAFDIRIGDINNDGTINLKDKQIVYAILDKDVIANKGGLGFYPGTMILHMDIRGKRARWNSYNR